MKVSEIIYLLEHGYTKDEIEKMTAENVGESDNSGGAAAGIPETPTEKTDANVTENDKETKPEPKPEPEESETEKLIKALGLKLDTAINAIHKSNVNNLEGKDEQVTVDDVLAQILSPTNKGGN